MQFKIAKQLELIDQSTIDILNYKARCDDQEKELEKIRSQLNENEHHKNSQINVVRTQLAEKTEDIIKLQDEV